MVVRLAASTAVVVLLVVAAVAATGLLEFSLAGATATKTSTVTTVQTSIQTYIQTVTETSLASTGSSSLSGRLYQVAFYENSTCGAYNTPWGVTLGGMTILEPSNATLSEMAAPGNVPLVTKYSNMTMIVFSLPSGVYNFTIYPMSYTDAVGASSEITTHGPSGIVNVTTSDASVYAISSAPPPNCTTQ